MPGLKRLMVQYSAFELNAQQIDQLAAIAFVDGEYLFVGGRYRPIASVPKRGKGPPVEPERGIWMSRSASLGYSEDAQLLPGTRLRWLAPSPEVALLNDSVLHVTI